MVHIIKVYFAGPNQTVQIRRLAVNSEVVSRFDLLARKIQEMFPAFAHGHIEVTWKDSENDVIHMSSDEELAQALASTADDILRIYAYSSENQLKNGVNQTYKSSHNAIHQNVICDGCDKTICGYRYKCLQCRNFDLCSTCNIAEKHGNHDMLKLVNPTQLPREWVFPGARKLWRSMFGRCPYQYFASATANDNEQANEPDSKKKQWPEVIDDLLKGGYVSADKLIKENLGNFLNFIDSVSGNVDVKIENLPNKQSPCKDNKFDQTNNNVPSNAEPMSSASPPKPKEEEPKVVEKLVHPVVVEKEQNENSTKPCGLFCNDTNSKVEEQAQDQKVKNDKDVASKPQKIILSSAAEVMDAIIRKQLENAAKPSAFFCDKESADGWTILNKQEIEKKETIPECDNGAKPKYPNLYPSVVVKTHSSEISAGNANDETKLKEVASIQTPVAQALPKFAENEGRNENVTSCQNPEIMNALVKMQAMGFTNEGGWLERLLITKDGNINATLDALYPNARRQ